MTTLHPHPGAGLWLIPAAATIIHLRGEHDFATGQTVRERLLRVLRHSGSLLILDLSGVSFCDAAGLSVLVGVQHQTRSLDIALGLAAPRPHPSKVVCLTGLDRSFAMHGGRVEAGAAAAR